MNLANISILVALSAAVSAVACDSSDHEFELAPLAQEVTPTGPKDKSPLPPTIVGVETLDVTIPGSLHAQALDVPAKLVRPKWSQPVGKQPALMLLHGSGGLTKMPQGPKDDPCNADMEAQYTRWSELLAERGYVVLLPSSYEARGFCDYHKDVARIPKDFDEKQERNIARLYDYDAAARHLCALEEVDCARMGLIGFSNGATLVMLALHWQVEQIPARLRELYADAIDTDIPDMAPDRPIFRVGIAYYPGCGFDDLVAKSTAQGADIQEKFFPTAPLFIEHGSLDPLLTDCSKDWSDGIREIQSAQVADSLQSEDLYHITVYEDAHHSFDDGAKSPADLAAREAAELATMQHLAEYLQ